MVGWLCHRCEQAKSSGRPSLGNLEKLTETEKQKDNIIIDIGGRVPKEICPDLSTSLLTRELSKNTKRGTNTIVIVHIKFKTKVCKKVHVTKEV